MEQWIRNTLPTLFSFSLPDDQIRDFVNYVTRVEGEKDLDECLKSLLDLSNSKHREFVSELKKLKSSKKTKSDNQKVDNNDNTFKKQNGKKKGKNKKKENVQPQEIAIPEKVEKKKTKFVNLYSQEGRDRSTVLLNGRHKCNCEATKHALLNNCMNCGRIVCVQEGPGPCFFCETLVCSKTQQAILSSNSKQSDHLYNKLISQKLDKGFADSLKHRDRLLENDRNSTRCTKVIDDQSDYYQSSNIWLSAKEREKLEKLEETLSEQKHASRLSKKLTFDFTGRQVIDEDEPINEFTEEQFQDLCASIPFDELSVSNICPTIEFNRPKYVETSKLNPREMKASIPVSIQNRIQDKEYLEISDEGWCLSMHQPYASLLVAGIKIHEGRIWYTSHRGRLWIAAASKTPNVEEISVIQDTYRILKDENIKFPESYPTSCLLGCVTVVDVLPQEEYRKLYPKGESDAPFVLICENFRTLPIKFPIPGKHKIYKLDPKIHRAAVNSLEKLAKTANI